MAVVGRGRSTVPGSARTLTFIIALVVLLLLPTSVAAENPSTWSGRLAHITSGSERIADSIQLSSPPYRLAFDSANGLLYVVPYSGNFLTVVNPTTGSAVASIPTGLNPTDVVFDPANDYVYVANWGSSNVTNISGQTNTQVGSIGIGPDANAITYDSTNGDLYVAEQQPSVVGSSNVTVINGTTNSVLTSIVVGSGLNGGGANGVTFDSSDNKVFASYLFYSDYVLLQDSGVAAINGTTNTLNSTLPVGNWPGGLDCIQYDPEAGEVFACDSDNSLVYVVKAKSNQLIGTDPVGSTPGAAIYDPANDKILIVNNGSNNVSEIDGATGKVVGSLPVGSGPTGAAYDSANCEVYVANPGSDNLTALFGGESCQRETYAVTFTETGLPSGANWSASLPGVTNWSRTTSIEVTLTNGTYAYSIISGNTTFRAPGGTLVVDGTSRSVLVSFSPVTYLVTLSESGLPPGTMWWFNITGQHPSYATAAAISLSLANGTYSYRVGTASTEYLAPGGSFSVKGNPLNLGVRFALVASRETFLGVPATEGYALLIGAIAAVSAVVITQAVFRHRKKVRSTGAKPPV